MSKMKYLFPFYGKLLHDSDCWFSIKTPTEDEYIFKSSGKVTRVFYFSWEILVYVYMETVLE